MINVAIAFQLLLLLGFDYLPGSVRLGLSGLINVIYVLSVVVFVERSGKRSDLILGLPVVLYLLLGIIGFGLENIAQEPNQASAVAALRQLSPYVALIALITCRSEISRKLLAICVLLVLVSAGLHAALLPEVYLNHTLRHAPFSANLHATGYAISAVFLILLLFYRTSEVRNVWLFFLAAIATFLLIGNGVRTPVLFLLSYRAIDFALTNTFLRERRGTFLLICSAAALALFAIVLTLDIATFNQLSSGRISNYVERFEIIYARDLRQLLFGTGPGSDLIKTSTWWWDAKDSHSDVLKILWEGGILGLIIFLWFWALVGLRNQGALLSFAAAIMVVSLVSNAYISRPNSAFLVFAFAAALQSFRESSGKQPL